jgi:hypothetical protein
MRKRRTPWLVGQRIHQLKAAPHGLGMDGVDVGDLDGDLRDHGRRGILAYDAELGGRRASLILGRRGRAGRLPRTRRISAASCAFWYGPPSWSAAITRSWIRRGLSWLSFALAWIAAERTRKGAVSCAICRAYASASPRSSHGSSRAASKCSTVRSRTENASPPSRTSGIPRTCTAVKFQVGADGPSPYQAGEMYPLGPLEDQQHRLPGEQLRDDGVRPCRMPDDDELLGSASRVVHGIQQAGNVRGPQVAGAPDHEQRPSVLPDEPPNVLHRLHYVLGPFEHVSPTPACAATSSESSTISSLPGALLIVQADPINTTSCHSL